MLQEEKQARVKVTRYQHPHLLGGDSLLSFDPQEIILDGVFLAASHRKAAGSKAADLYDSSVMPKQMAEISTNIFCGDTLACLGHEELMLAGVLG